MVDMFGHSENGTGKLKLIFTSIAFVKIIVNGLFWGISARLPSSMHAT